MARLCLRPSRSARNPEIVVARAAPAKPTPITNPIWSEDSPVRNRYTASTTPMKPTVSDRRKPAAMINDKSRLLFDSNLISYRVVQPLYEFHAATQQILVGNALLCPTDENFVQPFAFSSAEFAI